MRLLIESNGTCAWLQTFLRSWLLNFGGWVRFEKKTKQIIKRIGNAARIEDGSQVQMGAKFHLDMLIRSLQECSCAFDSMRCHGRFSVAPNRHCYRRKTKNIIK